MINDKQSIFETELEFSLRKFSSTFPILQDFPYLHLSGSEVMLTHPLSFFESNENISFKLDEDNEFIRSIVRSLQAKELSRYRIQELINMNLTMGPIEGLNLSTRTYNCLKRRNINSVPEILGKTFQDLTDIPNFGRGSADDLFYAFIYLIVIDLENKEDRKYLETPHINVPKFNRIESTPPQSLDEAVIEDWKANNREIYESVLNQEFGPEKFPNFTSDQDELFFRVANIIQFINPDITFGEILKLISIFHLKPMSEVYKWEMIAKNTIVNSNEKFHFKNWGNFFHDWNLRNVEVLQRRLLQRNPATLQEIADGLGLTRERIRQIENGVKDAIFAQVSDKDSILTILSSYFSHLVGNIARKSTLIKENEWLNSNPIPGFYVDGVIEPGFYAYPEIKLIDVLILITPNIDICGDLIVGGLLLKENRLLEVTLENTEGEFAQLNKSYNIESYKNLFNGVYSDEKCFDEICKHYNFQVLWKCLVPAKLSLSKKLIVILKEAMIPLEISSIISALDHEYAKKSVLNELGSNPMFEQSLDGLWQIKKGRAAVGNERDLSLNQEFEVSVETDRLALETLELDPSEVIKLKRLN